jgi:hypothetical protein
MPTPLTDQQLQNVETNLITALETHTGESFKEIKLEDVIEDGCHSATIFIRVPFKKLTHLISTTTHIGAPKETAKP